MELVDVVARCPLLRAVGGHAPPNVILNHMHGKRLELGAGLFRVEADEAVLHIHIRAVIEEVERAVHIRVDGLGHVVRVLIAIGGVRVPNLDQRGVQVGQRWHIVGATIRKVAGIHRPRCLFDHGLLPEGERTGADDDLEQRHEEVDLEWNRVVAVAVVRVDVHGVDALAARWRNADHLPVQLAHQRRVFALGIANDHVVAGQDEHDKHLALGRERFAAAGCAEDQPVWVLEQFAIDHDEVVAQRVDAVIERLRSALAELLGHERHEDRRGTSGQAPLDWHQILRERERGHEPLLLLKVQPDERAIVLLRDACSLKRIVFQLLAGLACVDDQERDEKHPLVATLQLLE